MACHLQGSLPLNLKVKKVMIKREMERKANKNLQKYNLYPKRQARLKSCSISKVYLKGFPNTQTYHRHHKVLWKPVNPRLNPLPVSFHLLSTLNLQTATRKLS